MSTNLILCGVGGQGTVLASKLIAHAALAKGIPVKTAETIGMAQRGGSVFRRHHRLVHGAYHSCQRDDGGSGLRCGCSP